MWVIKLGGSLANYPDDLKCWLRLFAETGRGKVVIVPGGSFFADWVREAQKQWGFDDAAAHAMGLRAMEQYGLMLCGMQKGLILARTETEISSALHDRLVPVWLPVQTLASEDLSPSWDLTSDSLAAWLARRLDAERLMLVKSCPLPEGEIDIAAMSAQGVVDAAFPGFVHAANFDVRLVNREAYSGVSAQLIQYASECVKAGN